MQRVVTLLIVSIATATRVQASPDACRDAIVAAAARYDQATWKVLGSCQQHHVADCDGDARTAAKIARAAAKLQSSIALRCCGPDRICGTGDDEALGTLGWGAGFCPNLDRSDCNTLISGPDDIAPCLTCIGHTAANDLAALTSVPASSGSDALARCASAIAREGTRLEARTSRALAACWAGRAAGKHANACPVPGDGKAAAVIAAAVTRARASICKACGGADRVCGGADDIAPAILGYPDACPAVSDPDGSACGGPISTLSDRRELRHVRRGPSRGVHRPRRGARVPSLPPRVRRTTGHLRSGSRVRQRRGLSRRVLVPRQRLRYDALLRRSSVRRRRRVQRRSGLPAVLHVRRLWPAAVRVPGLRVWRGGGVHRRWRPRLPRAVHRGCGLSGSRRRLRQFHLRLRTLHQLDPLPLSPQAKTLAANVRTVGRPPGNHVRGEEIHA